MDNVWWSSGVGKSNMIEFEADLGWGSRRVGLSSEAESWLMWACYIMVFWMCC